MNKLLFVGDTMIHNTETLIFDKEFKDFFSAHDLKCCNLEGPVVKDADEKKDCKLGPSICQNSKSVEILKDKGFNLFCLANNHITDYGLKGVMNTIEELGETPYIGAGCQFDLIYKPYIFEKNGEKIGILNLAEGGFGCAKSEENFSGYGYAWIFNYRVYSLIQDMKKKCTFVIAVIHAGLEDFSIPLPEWRANYKLLVDYGVDMVIAHHPHVIQGWECYREKYIFYSLGNFVWKRKREKKFDPRTVVLSVDIENGVVTDFSLIPIVEEDGEIKMLHDDFHLAIENMNRILGNEKEYKTEIMKVCKNCFELFYKSYIIAENGFQIDNNIVSKLKNVVRMIIYGNRLNYPLLYHNLSIETHRYVLERIYRMRLEEQK